MLIYNELSVLWLVLSVAFRAGVFGELHKCFVNGSIVPRGWVCKCSDCSWCITLYKMEQI